MGRRLRKYQIVTEPRIIQHDGWQAVELGSYEELIDDDKSSTPASNLPSLLSVKEVANLLSLSQSHVYNLITAGEIPAYGFGASKRLDPKDVKVWLESTRVGSINKKSIDNHVESEVDILLSST